MPLRLSLRNRAVLAPLAASLAQQDWTEPALRQHLHHRLPGDQPARAATMARDPLSNRHLPQGAPTSPALANLIAHQLDRRLSGLARSLEAHYTRYADDLSFSGDARITPILLRAVPQITAEHGFRLNPGKTRSQPAYRRQTVTGLTVNAQINPARENYDVLKATIHHLGRADDPRRQDQSFLAQLCGRIAWVEQVNPAKGAKLRTRLTAALLTAENA